MADVACATDADCSKSNANAVCGPALHCLQYCQLTSECQKGQYCDSPKSKLIRDVKRISDLQDIALALNQYIAKNKSFPSLPAGSYLPGRSTSVWPSWNETLGQTLGYQLPVDPANKLGPCPGSYDATTCWDEKNKKFATDFAKPILPVGSLAYAYGYKPNEGRYFLCGNFETAYDGLPLQLMCDKTLSIVSPDYPQIVFGSMIEAQGHFEGFFQVNSPTTIDWSKTRITPVSPAKWSDWVAAGWKWENNTTGLLLSDTGVANQKKLSAAAMKLSAGKGYQYFRVGVHVVAVNGNYGDNEATIRICQPRDCSTVECGLIDDNCGGTLLCGDCTGGKSCVANKCI